MDQNPRPEELIAHIHARIRESRESGLEPQVVVMSLSHYRLLDWYRKFIGTAEKGDFEYLAEHRIFGLEILIDSLAEPEVRAS